MVVHFRSTSTQSGPERKEVTAEIERRKKLQAEADLKVEAEKAAHAEEAATTQR